MSVLNFLCYWVFCLMSLLVEIQWIMDTSLRKLDITINLPLMNLIASCNKLQENEILNLLIY